MWNYFSTALTLQNTTHVVRQDTYYAGRAAEWVMLLYQTTHRSLTHFCFLHLMVNKMTDTALKLTSKTAATQAMTTPARAPGLRPVVGLLAGGGGGASN